MRRFNRRAVRGVHRVVGRFLPSRLFSRSYSGIPGRIHIDDPMFESDAPEHVRHYSENGLSAIQNIDASLHLAGMKFSDVRACLDLPSGYGRVTRHLAARIEPHRITACDLDRQAVRFCGREFGVKPLISQPDVRRIVLPETYDLIFVGSLLTHLPPGECLALLEVLVRVLSDSGLLIFTTQGATCLEHLDWYGQEFAAAERQYRQDVERQGVSFRPYPRTPHYGITIHARDYIERAMQARAQVGLIRLQERGWDTHQDVWSYRRVDGGPRARQG